MFIRRRTAARRSRASGVKDAVALKTHIACLVWGGAPRREGRGTAYLQQAYTARRRADATGCSDPTGRRVTRPDAPRGYTGTTDRPDERTA